MLLLSTARNYYEIEKADCSLILPTIQPTDLVQGKKKR